MTIDEIAAVLSKRISARAANEMVLHEAVKELIKNGELPNALYECRLGAMLDTPRVDFYFTREKIGLEVKVAGPAGQVVRQLYSYEKWADGLILMTTKRMAIDQELFEKPFRQVVLFFQ